MSLTGIFVIFRWILLAIAVPIQLALWKKLTNVIKCMIHVVKFQFKTMISKIKFYEYYFHPFLILSYFHLWAIINNVAMDTDG